jgi:hypothetical protein
MPVFFQWRHIVILAVSFQLLLMVFNASIGFLKNMLFKITDWSYAFPDTVWYAVALDSGMYSLTLAALMMISFKHMQVVFTEDKFSFTSMDIRHRPFADFLRFVKFGLLFCAARFAILMLLFLPFAIVQILSEHGIVHISMLSKLSSYMFGYSFVTLLIEVVITACVLKFLFGRKYLRKRLCLMQHA